MRCQFRRLAVCLLLATFSLATLHAPARGGEWDGVAFQQKASEGIAAWLVLPTRMVLDDADLPANLPAEPTPYRLSAARNEWECLQLVLMLATPIRNASVDFSEFKTADGEAIGQWAWATNLVAQVPGRVPQRAASMIKTWPVRSPDVKPEDITPGMYSPSASNVIPDALLRDATYDLDSGLHRVWLTVGVPGDARPGEYSGTVRVRSDGSTLFEIPIALRVWKQALPDEPTVTVMADVSPDLPPDLAPAAGGRSLLERLKPYYENLKYHYINATGEIYPLKPFRREVPPPDTDEYEQALAYVLDELGFARFRFPGVADAAAGTWQGMHVFRADAPKEVADGLWISGSAFSRSHPPATPAPGQGNDDIPHWTRIAGQNGSAEEGFGAATLAGYTEQSPAWVEYEFQTTASGDEPVHIYLQVAPVQPKERKIVTLDGKELGALTNEQFLRHPLGFAPVGTPVKLEPGKHTLRVAVDDVVGAADPIYGIFVTASQAPDLDLLLRERAALDERFKYAFAYHVEQMGDLLRRRKWLRKAQAKLKEDVGVGEFGRAAAVYDFVAELLPTLRREVPDVPSPMLRSRAEVWTPHLAAARFDPEAWQLSLKPGDELWAQHNFLHTLGYPSIAMRIIPWTLGRHGIRGYQFWSVNYWHADPWTDTRQNGSHMRGTLLYPDPKTGEPVNSVRWELFREGMEDYETLRMLRAAVDEMYGLDKAEDATLRSTLLSSERLLSDEVAAFVRDARDFSWDPARLEDLRTRAGELLDDLTPAEHAP